MALGALRVFGWIALVAVAVSGCGGGGDDNDCSGGKDVVATVVYDKVDAAIEGQPFVRTARTPGIPSECEDSRRFAVRYKSLPPGLSLDGRNGTISGTPNQAGFYDWLVTVTLPGYSGDVSNYGHLQVHRPASYTYGGWRAGKTLPKPTAWLLATDSALMLLRAPAHLPAEVQTSKDGGVSWAALATANAPVLTKEAVTLTAGPTVYVSHGRFFYRFDGATWTLRTDAAPLGFGVRLVKMGNRLFAIGSSFQGRATSAVLTSDDDGATWLQRSSQFLPDTDLAQCAFELAGQVTVVSLDRPAPGVDNIKVRRTTDGTAWTEVALPATSPLLAFVTNEEVCTVNGNRAYVTRNGGLVVSSTNGVDWQFERPFSNPSASSAYGATSFEGRVYVLAEMGVSNQAVYSTTD